MEVLPRPGSTDFRVICIKCENPNREFDRLCLKIVNFGATNNQSLRGHTPDRLNCFPSTFWLTMPWAGYLSLDLYLESPALGSMTLRPFDFNFPKVSLVPSAALAAVSLTVT